MRQAVTVVLVLLAIAAVVAASWLFIASMADDEDPQPQAGPGGEPIPNGVTEAVVAGVSDGDTIRVEVDGQVVPVRLILIDTPETRQPNSPVECYGPEASAHLKELLPEGTTVYLEQDVSDTDRFGRLLRYVWVPAGGNGGGTLVNERMVREGFAALSTYPPDVKHVGRIRAAQAAARAEGLGLWPQCGGIDTPLGGPTPTTAPAVDEGLQVPGDDRNCTDFTSQAGAQAAWEAAGGSAGRNVWGLDQDRNGIACEGLP